MSRKTQLVTIRVSEQELTTLTNVVQANGREQFWTRTPGRTIRTILDLVTVAADAGQPVQTQ